MRSSDLNKGHREMVEKEELIISTIRHITQYEEKTISRFEFVRKMAITVYQKRNINFM